MKELTIVVVAYNRPDSLNRILKSLLEAEYQNNVKLIISIDRYKNEEQKLLNIKTYNLAKEFKWSFGEKEIIYSEINLGLKAHILKCGDLTKKYENIILLEDDLYLSPKFYKFSNESLEYYEKEKKIAGISLFTHCYNETARLPFFPLEDDSDVFFMQIASSWGQIWNRRMWKNFREWLKENPDIDILNQDIPKNVREWGENSWKKHYIEYMIKKDLYFVYPKQSLSINFIEAGTNFKKIKFFEHKDRRLQSKMQYFEKEYKFKKIEESYLKYDAYCELEINSLKKLNKYFGTYNFIVDLYGVKDIKKEDNNKYILTSRKLRKIEKSYGLDFKPQELNILFEQNGEFFSFGKVIYLMNQKNKYFQQYQYFYIDIINLLKDFLKKLIIKKGDNR